MPNYNKLRGLVSQRMGGGKSSPPPHPYINTAPGAFTYTVPVSGRYKIWAWGPGGAGTFGARDGGGSGGLCVATVALARGQVISGTLGTPGVEGVVNATATTVTIPGRSIGLSAGGGQGGDGLSGGLGGTATGGDVNYNGSRGGGSIIGNTGLPGAGEAGYNGGTATGAGPTGAGAPGAAPFKGGDAGPYEALDHQPYMDPGAGGSSYNVIATRAVMAGAPRIVIARLTQA
jgi:hypothetical protein